MSGSGAGWKFRQATARGVDQRRPQQLPEQEREHQVHVGRARPSASSAYSSSSLASRRPCRSAARSRRWAGGGIARLGRAPPRPPPPRRARTRCSSAPTAERLCLPRRIALTRAPRRAPGSARPIPSQEKGPPRRPRAPLLQRGPRRRGRPPAAASASRSAAGSSGRHQLGGAVHAADLREAADVGEHHRLAEGQRRVEHARLVDPAVGQHHHVGAAEEGRQLGVGHEAVHEAHRAARLRRGGLERLDGHPRPADDPQLGALDLAEGVHQHVDALVRAQHPEPQDHRALHRAPARRAAAPRAPGGPGSRTRRGGSRARARRVGAEALDAARGRPSAVWATRRPSGRPPAAPPARAAARRRGAARCGR